MEGKKQLLPTIGAVFTAVLASSCCWLPLLLIVLGVGGATLSGVTSTIDELRWLFAAGAFILLGTAFYLTYRRPKPAPVTNSEESSCAPKAESEDACCPPTVGKIQKFNRFFLPLIALVVMATVVFPETVIGALVPSQDQPQPQEKAKVSEAEVVIKVSGMT